MTRQAIVLLSGGLDATTVLAIAKSEGFAVHAISFNYGQRHLVELDCAKRVALAMGAREHVAEAGARDPLLAKFARV